MSTVAIPSEQWSDFLAAFSRRHAGWLVTLDTHDFDTGERVSSEFKSLESIELDLEDASNPRINVLVRSENKEIKHILFRPSRLALHVSRDGTEEAIQIESVNTSTTVRLRVAIQPELVDGVA